MSKEAKALFDEAATLVPTLQKTTDPKTHKKLVPNKPAPNVALAAAGLGLHREAYKNGAKAMAEPKARASTTNFMVLMWAGSEKL